MLASIRAGRLSCWDLASTDIARQRNKTAFAFSSFVLHMSANPRPGHLAVKIIGHTYTRGLVDCGSNRVSKIVLPYEPDYVGNRETEKRRQ
jgi:hypothetical protein